MSRVESAQMCKRRAGTNARGAQGFSLIEVMISVLILGVGMLGIAAMQATALKNNQGAMQRSQAVIQTYTILDAMRTNRNNALLGQYNTGGKLCTAPAAGSLIAEDKKAWIDSLKASLGNADTTCGAVDCTDGDCWITVYWDDSRARNINAEGSTAQEIRTRAQL